MRFRAACSPGGWAWTWFLYIQPGSLGSLLSWFWWLSFSSYKGRWVRDRYQRRCGEPDQFISFTDVHEHFVLKVFSTNNTTVVEIFVWLFHQVLPSKAEDPPLWPAGYKRKRIIDKKGYSLNIMYVGCTYAGLCAHYLPVCIYTFYGNISYCVILC